MFKMAPAAMLNSSNQVFFDAIDEFIFNVATFLPNLVKIDLKLREQHQFVPVMFTDKGLLQILATLFYKYELLQMRAS